jgi:hypothetical protein
MQNMPSGFSTIGGPDWGRMGVRRNSDCCPLDENSKHERSSSDFNRIKEDARLRCFLY